MAAPKSLTLVLCAAAALALGVAVALWTARPEAPALEAGTLLPQPRALPPLQLTDQNGQPLGLEQLKGRWTVVFPGFTYCPDVCPTTLALLKRVHSLLGADAARVRVLLLSVDPERDSPERLKAYVQQFDPAFEAATAPEPQLAEAARALGVAYAKVPGASPESYQMDHSAALVVLDPEARLRAFLTPPLQAEAIAADLRRLLEQGS